jgi:UDP-GlcNAc:undecaprenyl-phosphate/decaprenyl-phosphate GlcNAc-1-phosphate transferase
VDRLLLAGMVLMATTVASALLVPLTRLAGRSLGIMDQPGERKVHQIPTARTGGWAVLITFLGAVMIGAWVGPSLEAFPALQAQVGGALAMLREAYRVETKLVALFVGCLAAFSVGLADDILGSRFPVVLKLIGQIAAACVLVAADVKTSIMPYDWMNVALTILWLVGITNAFNLLDNMDGLSGGVAFLAALILLVNAWRLDEYFVSLILLAFMGSLLGFLFFNFQPASVFLGDCGSHLIGFALGAMTLLERYVSHASGTLFPVLMPAIVLAVPIVDSASVIIIRLREGRPIYVGDSRHLSHTLVALGFSQRGAVLFLYLVTLCLGLGAVSLSEANLFQSLLILIQTAGFVAVTLILMYARARRSQEPA